MHNFVFGRAGGLAQLNNPNWPQFVSTFTPSKADEFIHHAHLNDAIDPRETFDRT
jgi:hypothetical protein